MSEQSAALDADVIKELRSLDGDEFFVELVEAFFKTALPAMEQLATALNEQDTDLVRQKAHGIKGSSGNIGAYEVMTLAKTLENQGRIGDLPGCLLTFPKLRAAFEKARRALVDIVTQVES